ncbi:MAG: hypothetical protein K0U84_21815 [Actinomycetia bacterium]|nr:hypothetical protein [Actinomycetes bacterium]
MTALPGEGWDEEIVEAIAPRHIDMARIRRFVAAVATCDGPGIAAVMSEAGEEGSTFRLLVAAAHQLAVEHDLGDPENLAEWRQGILYHLAQEEDGSNE